MADRYGVLTNPDGTVNVVYSDDNYHWHPIASASANFEWADTIATALNQVTQRTAHDHINDIIELWTDQPDTTHHTDCWRYHAGCAITAIVRHLEETA